MDEERTSPCRLGIQIRGGSRNLPTGTTTSDDGGGRAKETFLYVILPKPESPPTTGRVFPTGGLYPHSLHLAP